MMEMRQCQKGEKGSKISTSEGDTSFTGPRKRLEKTHKTIKMQFIEVIQTKNLQKEPKDHLKEHSIIHARK
jgi:hypothetical protein